MHDLEITWPTGQARFSPHDSPVAVGRSPEAAVVLTDSAVSRRHMEFVWLGASWIANDSSTHGSFDPIGVRLAPTWTIGVDTTLLLGGIEGTELQLKLVTPLKRTLADQASPAPTPQPPSAPYPVEPMVDIGHGSELAETAAPPLSISEDDSLLVRSASSDAGSFRFEVADPAPGPSLPPPDAGGISPFTTEHESNGQAPSLFADPPAKPLDDSPVRDYAPPQPPAANELSLQDLPRPAPSTVDTECCAGFSPPHPPAETPNRQSTFDEDEEQVTDSSPPFDDRPFLEGYSGDTSAVHDLPAVIGNGHSAFDDYTTPATNGATSLLFEELPSNNFGELQQAGPESDGPRLDAPPPPSPLPDPELDRFPSAPSRQWATDMAGHDAATEVIDGSVPVEQGQGYLEDQPRETATEAGDSALQLSIDGNDYVFFPGTTVSVGRDPSNQVRIDERHALASRRHLEINHHADAWWIEDYSSKGTFVDGRKLSSPYRAEGAFLVHLGGDEGGASLRLITAGEHRSRTSPDLILFAVLAAIAVLAVIVLAWALSNDSTAAGAPSVAGSEIAADDLAVAKQATVLLLSQEGTGSGFFVSENLIVTNQHVAVLSPSLSVAVSRDAAEPAEIEYRAETVALHPFLDIAVLKLTVDRADNPVDDAGLRPVSLGDTSSLTRGDSVYNTGFPEDLSLISNNDTGDLLLPPVSATSGEAASFSIWPGCSNPNRSDFIPVGSPPGVQCAPNGDLLRGIVITTFSSGQGASGSPLFQGREVVGVVFAGADDNENAGRNISAGAFADWLDEVIVDNR